MKDCCKNYLEYVDDIGAKSSDFFNLPKNYCPTCGSPLTKKPEKEWYEKKIKKHLRTFQRELADKTIYNNMLCDMSDCGDKYIYKEDKDIIEFRANQIVAALELKK